MKKKIPLRVLIIGSGKRVQNNFIPAFKMLPEMFELVGIHSKTKEHYETVGKRFDIPPVSTLTPEIYANVDVVAISVPMSLWPVFLPAMAAHAKDLTLIIDTPLILHSLSLFKTLSSFKKIVVTEDYISFPAFTLLREIADSGALGRVKKVRLVRNGFRYHGTSLIRSFLGFEVAKCFVSKVTSPDDVGLHMYFGKDAEGEIVEPYEGDTGYMEVTGELASITTAPEKGSFTHQLIKESEGGKITGYSATLSEKAFHIPLAHSDAIRALGVTDEFQIEKDHGLMEVFRSIVTENIHSGYHFTDALYDNYVSKVPRIASVGVTDVPRMLFGDAVIRSYWYWVYWRILSLYVRVKGKLRGYR